MRTPSTTCRPHRVALIYDATVNYDVCVIRGIAAYLQHAPGWNVFLAGSSLKDQRVADLSSWEIDGIVADFDDPIVAAAVMNSRLPAVGFGSGYGWYAPESHIPYFFTNNEAIARLAAEHLLARGFQNFAYCGYLRNVINGWSEEREWEFTKQTKDLGFACEVFQGGDWHSPHWATIQDGLCEWLLSLRGPVGIMAANDYRARQVLEACRVCGLQVPGQVAVIGVDNDEVVCQLSSPLLSSIEQGAQRIGYEAASLLDQIMEGKQCAKEKYLVDPVGVVARTSTDVSNSADPQVTTAVSFIREHACEGIKVPQVVAAVKTSRSALEARFKAQLGKTLHQAIADVKVGRAKSLLGETDLSPKEIAALTGFRYVQHMSSVFRETVGVPPAAYRRGLLSSRRH